LSHGQSIFHAVFDVHFIFYLSGSNQLINAGLIYIILHCEPPQAAGTAAL
jgi:hypothetical protein